MEKEYVKEFEGGKEVYKMLDGKGRPVREVKTADWDIEDYINYCLYPLKKCINRMHDTDELDSKIEEFVDMLDRLYDSTHAQLRKMGKAIYKDMGWIKIITTNESCRGGFLQQDFIEVCIQKEPDDEAAEVIRIRGAEIDAQNAVSLIAERDEWKKKFQEAEEARLLVSRKLSYYCSEESAGRLHIDPIPRGENLRKVKDTDKKNGSKVKRAA